MDALGETSGACSVGGMSCACCAGGGVFVQPIIYSDSDYTNFGPANYLFRFRSDYSDSDKIIGMQLNI